MALRPISTRQAAERLGVSPRRVRDLSRSRPDFPRPLDLDGPAPYWDAGEIEQWGATANRAPGRRWPATGPRPRSTREKDDPSTAD